MKRHALPEITRTVVRALGAFSREERWLVGVSGGRDSVVLLHLLQHHGFRDLIVCHCDHGLRADSSDDADFVRELAQKLGCSFVLGRRDVRAKAEKDKLSLETAARVERYAFFAETARAHSCPRIFLGHHADDQVETFLFQLFRGSGLAGLSAMALTSSQTIAIARDESENLLLARPLLSLWREQIDALIAHHGWPFLEDPTNADRLHARNRLRHEILPFLEKSFGREIRPALWRAAEICQAEDAFLSGVAEIQTVPDRLETRTLAALPLALQRRWIQAWLVKHGVTSVDFAAIEAVRSLLERRIAKVNLPGGRHARRRAREIFLETPPSATLCD